MTYSRTCQPPSGELCDWQSRRTRVEIRNLCVRKVELILVRNFTDNTKDEFTVRISAHAQKIARRANAADRQDEYVTPFMEFWTFGRLDNQWKFKEFYPPAEGGERWPPRMWMRTATPATAVVLQQNPGQ